MSCFRYRIIGFALSAVVFSAVAQGVAAQDDAPPYSAIYYSPGHPDILGFAQLKDSREEAETEALRQCEEASDGNCYQGLVYNQCGAVSELQMGNPTGNPKGWGPADTLQQALDISMQRCNYFARRIALNRYADDEVLLPRAKSGQCAVVYYHCTAWGPVDLEASFGVPEDPNADPSRTE